MTEQVGPQGQAAVSRLLNALGGSRTTRQPYVDGGIVPVIDLWPVMGQYEVDNAAAEDPVSAGGFNYLTVTVGETWKIFATFIERASGSSIDFDSVSIADAGNNSVRLIEQTAAIKLLYMPDTPFILPAGFSLRLGVYNYTSGDTLNARTYVQRFNQVTPPTL